MRNTQKACYCLIMMIVLLSLQAYGQLSCKDIHNGTFYYYPKNSLDVYTDVRADNLLHEKNEKASDTGMFEIKWKDDCTYQLKYLTSSSKNAATVEEVFNKYKILFKITRNQRTGYHIQYL